MMGHSTTVEGCFACPNTMRVYLYIYICVHIDIYRFICVGITHDYVMCPQA